MEETDTLDFLISIQGEIKRLRELAAQASDQKLASKLYRLADDMEHPARVIDRLSAMTTALGPAIQPSQLLPRLSLGRRSMRSSVPEASR
jgi:hypothetical protein